MIAKLLVLATIVMLVLKLAGLTVIATLSWWIIFLPLLIAVALAIIGFLIAGTLFKLADKFLND